MRVRGLMRDVVLLLASMPIGLQLAQADTAADADSTSAQSTEGLQDVTVTAQRREQSLLRVPLAISALTSADLQNQNVTSASGLSSLVPGEP